MSDDAELIDFSHCCKNTLFFDIRGKNKRYGFNLTVGSFLAFSFTFVSIMMSLAAGR